MAIGDETNESTSRHVNAPVAPAVFPIIDHNHPLFLQPTDTPGSLLISLQLTSLDNYALWSRSMRIGLLGKSKLGFVNGRYPKSKFELEFHEQWEKVNVVVLSWMNVVCPGLLSSVVYTSNAHKVWEDLKDRFDKVNRSRVLYLHRDIHTLTQGTMNVADNFSKLSDLWDEFDALMPCPGCLCQESKKYAEHFEYHRLLQFLLGLNDTHPLARNQIMMMILVPSINKAYSLLMDVESQRNLANFTQMVQMTEVANINALYGNKNPTLGNG
ncbi:uncharacterized protein LOC107797686 [Nicotiana tabacum]|uniref:Uncharacterized protein LOC107797686 n=1 Tax=Nicotiana tabacum TaxID=4097 RepID=A0A1S4AHF3_TOBAC|nr:PREDICTED: uncharacterized protein LOC107797686 [Nicotiana tabacum]